VPNPWQNSAFSLSELHKKAHGWGIVVPGRAIEACYLHPRAFELASHQQQ
jgi:hypothetical protein